MYIYIYINLFIKVIISNKGKHNINPPKMPRTIRRTGPSQRRAPNPPEAKTRTSRTKKPHGHPIRTATKTSRKTRK